MPILATVRIAARGGGRICGPEARAEHALAFSTSRARAVRSGGGDGDPVRPCQDGTGSVHRLRRLPEGPAGQQTRLGVALGLQPGEGLGVELGL